MANCMQCNNLELLLYNGIGKHRFLDHVTLLIAMVGICHFVLHTMYFNFCFLMLSVRKLKKKKKKKKTMYVLISE